MGFLGIQYAIKNCCASHYCCPITSCPFPKSGCPTSCHENSCSALMHSFLPPQSLQFCHSPQWQTHDSLLNCWGETVVNRNQALPFSSYKSLLPLMNEALFPQGNPISPCFWWNLSLRTNLFFFSFFPLMWGSGEKQKIGMLFHVDFTWVLVSLAWKLLKAYWSDMFVLERMFLIE